MCIRDSCQNNSQCFNSSFHTFIKNILFLSISYCIYEDVYKRQAMGDSTLGGAGGGSVTSDSSVYTKNLGGTSFVNPFGN